MDARRLKEMEPLLGKIDGIMMRGNDVELRNDGNGGFKVYELRRVKR